MSALAVLFHFLILHVLIEFWFALLAFRQEVETDTTDVLAGLELLGTVHLVALNLKFHHAPVCHSPLNSLEN